jgi:hypothetical protein
MIANEKAKFETTLQFQTKEPNFQQQQKNDSLSLRNQTKKKKKKFGNIWKNYERSRLSSCL